MSFVPLWVSFWVIVAILFGLFEGLAMSYGKWTLSRTVWVISKNWPPFGWVVGILMGFLAAHFFWPGQGCDFLAK